MVVQILCFFCLFLFFPLLRDTAGSSCSIVQSVWLSELLTFPVIAFQNTVPSFWLPFPVFWIWPAEKFHRFCASDCPWKTHFDWMGTAYERYRSFCMIYLSLINNVLNPYLTLSAIITFLLLGYSWKHWLMLRILKRLYHNGNTPVLPIFWGDF